MQTSETIAVLGAGGTMGFPMARNMAQAGLSVRVWNRTRDKAEPLSKDGAYVADTPAEAAYGAGIVVTMLSDADAVISAFHSALPAIDRTAVRDFSPALSLRLAAKDASLIGESALRHGLDLPVFETIAERLSEGAVAHGDKDFSATYLTSEPDRAA